MSYLTSQFKAFFAAMTAINSLMTAAAAMVPCTIFTNSGVEESVEQMIPVNTKDTPEWGNNVS